jgi:hypothetical protein
LSLRLFHRLKIYIVPFTLNNRLNPKLITSPPKKRTRSHSRVLVTQSEDDEERTCLEEIGDGAGEEENTTTK